MPVILIDHYTNHHQADMQIARDCRPVGLVVWLHLIQECDWHGDTVCYPTYHEIAQAIGASIATVRAAIRRLDQHGYITIESRFDDLGGRMSNAYIPLFTHRETYVPPERPEPEDDLPFEIIDRRELPDV